MFGFPQSLATDGQIICATNKAGILQLTEALARVATANPDAAIAVARQTAQIA
jgi:hypothetical protein